MVEEQSWQCPYCGHYQVLSNDNCKTGIIGSYFVKISEYGNVGLWVRSIACLNSQCKKLSLDVGIGRVATDTPFLRISQPLEKTWKLLPDSMAKPQPEYIPEHIRFDYEEACKIVNLSPKSAATLARRCIQAMINDFCKISKQNLYLEIEELKSKFKKNETPHGITIESIEAIDNVRKMGNIGAHMKMESNVIVDIDPEEGGLLIELIEMLFKEWYVARHDREERLNSIQRIVEKKSHQSDTDAEDKD